METGHDHPGEAEDLIEEAEKLDAKSFLAPGVPIVRSNTPRPISFSDMTKKVEQIQANGGEFPTEAPGAPPLPEELEERRNSDEKLPQGATTDNITTPLPVAPAQETTSKSGTEFIWLFEYGLQMERELLNRPDGLNKAALPYGPGVLKGYQITFDGVDLRTGRVVASITPSQMPGAEVWGVLYRVPRKLLYHGGEAFAPLDKAHSERMFTQVEVLVREIYRGRDVTCLTYVATETARQHIHLLPPAQRYPTSEYVQQLVACAQRQNLPASYVLQLEKSVRRESRLQLEASTSMEQNTDPLLEVTGLPWLDGRVDRPGKQISPAIDRWLVIFSVYLICLLLLVLTLAVFQASDSNARLFAASFAPLGVPWFVQVYGLLGGCMSCILSLGRRQMGLLPTFVLLTWFTRPFLGALLGAVVYLVLNCGLVGVVATQPAQRYALFAATGLLAGLCEGQVFFRGNRKTL